MNHRTFLWNIKSAHIAKHLVVAQRSNTEMQMRFSTSSAPVRQAGGGPGPPLLGTFSHKHFRTASVAISSSAGSKSPSSPAPALSAPSLRSSICLRTASTETISLHSLAHEAPPPYRQAMELALPKPPAPGMGITHHPAEENGISLATPPTSASRNGVTGDVSLRVWSPHASAVSLFIKDREVEVPMARDGDTWAVRVPGDVLPHGAMYQVAIATPDGRRLTRRDPWARSAEYTSNWCYIDNPSTYQWQTQDWELPTFDSYSIYELHVGSFTPQGTLEAAAARLDHISKLGFKAVQLMPLTEHSDAWGYNPRQLLALHRAYGTPDQMRAFVDAAHARGLAVIIDVVLHHGAVEGNALWEWDGWSPSFGHGGIFHEGAHDTQWGRAWAFWKREVRDYIYAASAVWLSDYKCDGLRFDSANDLPRDMTQELTWALHNSHPGRILTAEVTPENPMSVQECGFDSVWVHSGYFDAIQQHKALGRGHHGGGDWAAGWDLPRLRTIMVLHYGFNAPHQCIKYMLGSHDQVGCRNNGAWYEDYKMIGGQHRYAVDQYGGGRGDSHATACARLWWTANVVAACIPMMFMGTEWHQSGWWDIIDHRRPDWSLAEDDIGKGMQACVAATMALRNSSASIRSGWANVLHEDRQNGVVAFERVADGDARIVCVINAGRGSWQGGEYGVWVGGGTFQEILSSQAPEFGGWPGVVSNGSDPKPSYDGKLWINLPPQSTLVFKQVD